MVSKTRKTSKKTGGSEKIYSNNYVAKSNIVGAGYGVFANKNYKKGSQVEKNKFLEFATEKDTFSNYAFNSHLNPNNSIIVLGNGCMFNHSDNHNLNYYHDGEFIKYIANRNIKKHEELFIYYGDYWFKNRNIQKEQ